MKDSAYGTKPDTTLRCPKNLRIRAERRMTEYEKDETLLKKWNSRLNEGIYQTSCCFVIGKFRRQSLCFTNDAFKSFNFLSKTTRGHSEDVVKVLRPRNESGDFQHLDLSMHRSGRRKNFSWVKSSSRWSSASRDSSRKPRKHLT